MKSIRSFLVAAAGALALGCAAPSGAPNAESSGASSEDGGSASSGTAAAPQIVLGTGEAAFEALPLQDATLPVIAGPQGGWHITTAVQFHGFDPTNLSLRTDAIALDGETTKIAYPHALLLTEGRIMAVDDHFELVGDRVVFDIERMTDVVGRGLQLEATIQVGDEILTDVQRITVVEAEAP